MRVFELLGYSNKAVSILANLCTYFKGLPQGAVAEEHGALDRPGRSASVLRPVPAEPARPGLARCGLARSIADPAVDSLA